MARLDANVFRLPLQVFLDDDAFGLFDVMQPLRPCACRIQMMQRMTSAIPCNSSITPVIGIKVFSGKTGIPAGLKMLTSRNWMENLA